jgi:hypothetical protein
VENVGDVRIGRDLAKVIVGLRRVGSNDVRLYGQEPNSDGGDNKELSVILSVTAAAVKQGALTHQQLCPSRKGRIDSRTRPLRVRRAPASNPNRDPTIPIELKAGKEHDDRPKFHADKSPVDEAFHKVLHEEPANYDAQCVVQKDTNRADACRDRPSHRVVYRSARVTAGSQDTMGS